MKRTHLLIATAGALAVVVGIWFFFAVSPGPSGPGGRRSADAGSPPADAGRNMDAGRPARLIQVKAFFLNSRLDPEITCQKVFPVVRNVPEAPGPALAALAELLGGPTAAERAEGYATAINSGVTVRRLVIENGVAAIDFDERLQEYVGGSCRVTAIRAQITATLRQFPEVKEVVISIDGRTEDILQP